MRLMTSDVTWVPSSIRRLILNRKSGSTRDHITLKVHGHKVRVEADGDCSGMLRESFQWTSCHEGAKLMVITMPSFSTNFEPLLLRNTMARSPEMSFCGTALLLTSAKSE